MAHAPMLWLAEEDTPAREISVLAFNSEPAGAAVPLWVCSVQANNPGHSRYNALANALWNPIAALTRTVIIMVSVSRPTTTKTTISPAAPTTTIAAAVAAAAMEVEHGAVVVALAEAHAAVAASEAEPVAWAVLAEAEVVDADNRIFYSYNRKTEERR